MNGHEHNPLRPICMTEILPGISSHLCTCTFAGGEIVIVQVYGTADQREAHIIAEWLWHPFRRYRVSDGDISRGHARPFIVVLDHCWQQGKEVQG